MVEENLSTLCILRNSLTNILFITYDTNFSKITRIMIRINPSRKLTFLKKKNSYSEKKRNITSSKSKHLNFNCFISCRTHKNPKYIHNKLVPSNIFHIETHKRRNYSQITITSRNKNTRFARLSAP